MTLQSVRLNVLVVEDNPGDALLLEEYLRMTELDFEEIIHATTLIEGLQLAQIHKTDIVFLDLSLPDSKGLESFAQINERFSHLPVIILSGLNSNQVTLDAIAGGAQDYLVKGELSPAILQKSIQYSIERKRSQENVRLSNERFNAVSVASQDAIWDWNLKSDDFYSNDAMAHTLGYTREEISHGHAWWYANLHPDDKEKANNRFQKALVSGLDSWQHEYRFICKSGAVKYIFGRGIILRDITGNAYRLIGIMQDITPIYKLQQTLSEEQINKQKLLAQATIEGQEKERAELGKELHDNINQLLAATKLYLSVASTKEELRDEMITRSISNLSFCMEEIRKLSKALVPPSIGLINLSDALRDLTDTMQLTGALSIETAVEMNTSKLTGKQQLNLYRIVQEQLNNIIKHADAANADIRITESFGFVELSIRDDGRGFDIRSRHEGIGLKNIQSRAELLNGKMSVESSEGKGCLLKITFPVELSEQESPEPLVSISSQAPARLTK